MSYCGSFLTRNLHVAGCLARSGALLASWQCMAWEAVYTRVLAMLLFPFCNLQSRLD